MNGNKPGTLHPLSSEAVNPLFTKAATRFSRKNDGRLNRFSLPPGVEPLSRSHLIDE